VRTLGLGGVGRGAFGQSGIGRPAAMPTPATSMLGASAREGGLVGNHVRFPSAANETALAVEAADRKAKIRELLDRQDAAGVEILSKRDKIRMMMSHDVKTAIETMRIDPETRWQEKLSGRHLYTADCGKPPASAVMAALAPAPEWAWRAWRDVMKKDHADLKGRIEAVCREVFLAEMEEQIGEMLHPSNPDPEGDLMRQLRATMQESVGTAVAAARAQIRDGSPGAVVAATFSNAWERYWGELAERRKTLGKADPETLKAVVQEAWDAEARAQLPMMNVVDDGTAGQLRAPDDHEDQSLPGLAPDSPLPVTPGQIDEVTEAMAELERANDSGELTREEYEAHQRRIAEKTIGWKSAFAGLAHGWDDKALMSFALEAWTTAGGRYRKKHGRAPDIDALQHGVAIGIDELYRYGRETGREIAKRLAVFAVTWAEHAYQRLMTSHTYASALMCSDASREVLEDLEVPWLAFQVIIPDGILSLEDGTEYTRALIVVAKDPMPGVVDGATMILYDPKNQTPHRLVSKSGSSLATLLFDETDPLFVSTERPEMHANARSARVIKLARRLIAGLILAMQHRNSFRERVVHGGSKKPGREKDSPTHRIAVIGKPISVDCRGQVASYLEGTHRKNAPPTVQTLTRGHYKRQVIGVGRRGRKVIWVHPYWRGPEDAPILTKPKEVG
jgi:hypothetical protein